MRCRWSIRSCRGPHVAVFPSLLSNADRGVAANAVLGHTDALGQWLSAVAWMMIVRIPRPTAQSGYDLSRSVKGRRANQESKGWP